MSSSVSPPGSDEDSGKSRLLLGALVLLGVGLGAAYALWPKEEIVGPIYRTASVELRDLSQTVESTGTLQPRDLQLVMATVSGELKAVHVKPRQTVKAGDRLATLEVGGRFQKDRAKGQEIAAWGAVAKAKAAQKLAESEATRADRLKAQGQLSQSAWLLAQSKLESAKAGLQVARGQLTEAKAAYQAASQALEAAEIRAPKDGVVLQVAGPIGQTVGPSGRPLFQIAAPLTELELNAMVPESDIGGIKVGQAANFEVQAFPGQHFSATVLSIGLLADSRQGVASYPVSLKTPNDDARLLPGMTADLRFEVAHAENTLAVRDAALRFRPGDSDAPPRSQVYVLESDGKLRRVQVKAGITDGIWTAVTGELKPGDALAVGYLTGKASQKPGLKIGG